ncbi:MAG: ROK family protein [Spirochaetes bacterium]|nr:MAG: ROK family protein [Spirochaetota bacterium]
MAYGVNIDLRKTNKRNLIIDLFRRNEYLSKIQAKKLSGYSMDTVLSIFDGLARDELIVPSEGAQKPKGRKAVFFRLNGEKLYYLGVTFNQARILSTLVDFSNRVRDTATTELALGIGREQFLEIFRRHLGEFSARLAGVAGRIRNIGCSIPGDIDAATGVLRSYVFMPFLEGVNFCDILHEFFPEREIEVEHNIRSMTSYVLYSSDLVRRYRKILFVSARSGAASGLIHHGEIVTDRGEMGHVRVSDEDRRCACGRRGCLDLYFSHQSISEAISSLGAGSGAAAGHHDLQEIISLYGNDAPGVRAMMDERLRYFSSALLDMVNILEPDLVILSGELLEAYGDPVARIRAALAVEYADSGSVTNLKNAEIIFMKTGIEIAATGVCYHLINKHWGYVENGDLA